VNSEIWIPTILVQKFYGAKMQSIATGLVLLLLGCGVAVSMSSPYYGAGAGADDAVAVEISVAAPAGLNAAMTDVARAFESKTGNHVHLTFVDADTLYSQIRSGATFDAVFFTDMQDVRRLITAHAAVAASLTEYARDELVMCISPTVRFQFPPGNPLLALRDKTISHIAVSDPQKTTSGKVVEAALKTNRDYDLAVRRKLLIGKDNSEVAQFLEHGDADVALLPMTAARASGLWGARVIPISPRLYPPIRMGAVVMMRSKRRSQAVAFLKFAASPDGRKIFRADGF
jgi:molybdate transport system substrate-binding protein